MKILKIAQAEAAIGQQEERALNVAITSLINIPALAPMVSNANTKAFLTRFFHALAADPTTMNGFHGLLQAVNAAMKRDAAGSQTNSTSQG